MTERIEAWVAFWGLLLFAGTTDNVVVGGICIVLAIWNLAAWVWMSRGDR